MCSFNTATDVNLRSREDDTHHIKSHLKEPSFVIEELSAPGNKIAGVWFKPKELHLISLDAVKKSILRNPFPVLYIYVHSKKFIKYAPPATYLSEAVKCCVATNGTVYRNAL